jgi:hypothetical protein
LEIFLSQFFFLCRLLGHRFKSLVEFFEEVSFMLADLAVKLFVVNTANIPELQDLKLILYVKITL